MRGIAIAMVVMHHAIISVGEADLNFIAFYFNKIHVVIFFIISGYLFELNFKRYKEMGILNFYIKKFKELGIPYLFWTLFLDIGIMVFSSIPPIASLINQLDFQPMRLKEIVVNTITFNEYYVQLLWFIYVLFFMFLLNYLLKSKHCNLLSLIISLIISLILINFVDMPFILDKFFKHLPNFIIGRLLYKNRKVLIFKGYVYSLIGPFVLTIVLDILCINLSQFQSFRWFIYLIYYLIGWLGFWYLWNFSYTYALNKKRKILIMLGDYSLSIYLMHHPYFILLMVVLLKSINGFYFLKIILVFMLGIIGPIIMDKFIINKNKILGRILLGRE